VIKKIILISGALICTLGLTLGVAQEETKDWEEIAGYAYGPVVRISAKKIVIAEYDYETEQDVEKLFIINTETKFENAKAYYSIKSGDQVEIEFEKVGEQKIAKLITKEIDWKPEHGLDYESEEESQGTEYIEDSGGDRG